MTAPNLRHTTSTNQGKTVSKTVSKTVRKSAEVIDLEIPAGERSRLLVEAAKDYAMIMLDRSGRIASWSAGAQEMTGFPAAEVLGGPDSCLYSGEDVAAGKPKALLSVAAAHGRAESEGWMVRKDGSRFWAEVIIRPIADPSGALLGYAEVARDATARVQLERDLGQDNDRMRSIASHYEHVAEQEKMRLAREIHDVLGQELTGLKLDAAWLARRIGGLSEEVGAPLLERLLAMSAQTDACIQTVRRIATGLRPGVLDDLGLTAAIEWQARELQARSGLEIELSLPEDDMKLDAARGTAIFRIFQELLTNVIRHAGASRVSVLLVREADCVVLEVNDDGRGITAPEQERALGLMGMQERAAQFGGALEIRGAAGLGTYATLRMPGP